jgi:hypothetical protein
MLAGERHGYFRLARNAALEGEAIDPAGMRRHAACFQWLTELSLEHSALDIATLEQLMALPEVRRLKRLSLAQTGLRDTHAAVLGRGENLAGLAWLDVSSNDIGATGAASLIGQDGLANLEFLNLASCKFTFGELASALSMVPPRKHPIRLQLTGTTVNSAGLAPDPAGFAAFVRSDAFAVSAGSILSFMPSRRTTQKRLRNRLRRQPSAASKSTRARWEKRARKPSSPHAGSRTSNTSTSSIKEQAMGSRRT